MVAGVLSKYFSTVYATDISEKQLQQAVRKENITYSIQPAEKTSFTDDMFDLVTVAQAIHWFQFSEFYAEVKRTLKPRGVLAVIGYGLMQTSGFADTLIKDFYTNTIGSYWDAERKYIDQEYRTIPFPFNEIAAPSFTMDFQWTHEQLLGYLGTWSAVQHYKAKTNTDPLATLSGHLLENWGSERVKQFTFPLLLRVARPNT